GFLIHPGTGWLIEAGTGYLVEAGSLLYTNFRWDPVTGVVVEIVDDQEPAGPTPSPAEPPSPSPTAAATAVTSPSPAAAPAPSATASPSLLAAVPGSDSEGADGSGWLVRTLVILGLIGAGALYYIKLRGSSAKAAFTR
ncbi:hypothetical protein QMA10_10005, partial [Arthrobacter sp. APC 3897]|uniref:hypothetical protein n=1 Tax=Arthrobacter sp. APC 3897 TaxID=3035204 RepID=UPI0025B434BE